MSERNQRRRWLECRLILVLAICGSIQAAESGPPDPPTNSPIASAVDTNSQQDTMRSLLQLQEQMHATRLAMERDRQENAAAAAQNAAALAARLESIERSLAGQRASELDAFQSSNRMMVTVACTFAAVGLAGLLLMAYSHWRSIQRLADIAAALPSGFGLRPGHALPALESGDTRLLPMAAAEQSNVRLLGAMEKLEKRILELEHNSRVPAIQAETGGNGPGHLTGASNGGPAEDSATSIEEREGETKASSLLNRGQSLLDRDQSESALSCFEEALMLEPGNAEALVKKGAALERLRKPEEALKCYDEAIAKDKSLTIAYLYKGGLFNRQERFTDALQCYELALRTQEKRGG